MDFNGYINTVQLDSQSVLSNGYPFNIPSIKKFKKLNFHPKVTYLIGENGMGKSTLLEAIAIGLGFNAEGGSKNFNFATQSTHSDLHRYLKFSKGIHRMKDGFFLRGESFYNVASQIDELDKEPGGGASIISSYGGKSLHEQSHGESFWALFMNRFGGSGLYILDEPESALSITRQMAMLAQMDKLINKRSQFIIATHSPIILAYPDATIYQMTPDGIHKVTYKETDIYQLYKGFLDNPDQMTSILIDKRDRL
ncbi:MAG: AAA family ATPase [Candidatus Pedobacter colombiensis]|uniref:AAA family ATPase n=1 Tax=Candidatus Pedobacter colombiensis TaxID=3121371 RepID=A0AAJ5W643_9SPHI|nr:AAA family ATPase [Pedobacter sp.]WEK18682.1 MAG: AAA family ATPase [Pedobacter sp.]